MTKSLILDDTLRELDATLRAIRTHPEYSYHIKLSTLDYLRKEALKHSTMIEDAKSRPDYARLESARTYLLNQGITFRSISHLGHLVQPVFEEGENKGKPTPVGLRNVEVSFGKRFFGVTPNLVRPLIQDLVDYLSGAAEQGYTHPVVRATEAHIRLVKIHPYVDGNGRTARILQNFCLEQSDYPPAIIDVSEKGIYFELLSWVLSKKTEGREQVSEKNQTEEDITFQTFIASKVLQSSRKLEEELRKKRLYSVEFSHLRGKGALYSTADILRHHRTDNHVQIGLTVSIKGSHGNEGVLEIRGDISKRDLESELSKATNKYNAQFKVTPLTNC